MGWIKPSRRGRFGGLASRSAFNRRRAAHQRKRPRQPPSPAPTPPGDPAGSHSSPSDIRSFVRGKSPKSHMQLAAAVAYFLKFVAPPQERKESISAEDFSDAIRKVGGWSQPKRPIMTLTNAKNQGYLDAIGGGTFRLNSVGENLVTMTLGADGATDAP